MIIATPIYIFIFLEVLFVTYLDVKYKKIKNAWSLLNLVLAGLLFFIYPAAYELKLASFQYSFVFIIVGFALFLLKIMGGGDSKFLASFFLIVPYKLQDQVFFFLLISTIIIGSMFFIRNLITHWNKLSTAFREKDLHGVKSCFGTKFAFAPVILTTWILTGINIYQ